MFYWLRPPNLFSETPQRLPPSLRLPFFQLELFFGLDPSRCKPDSTISILVPLGPAGFLKMNSSHKKGTWIVTVGILWTVGLAVTLLSAVDATKVVINRRRRSGLIQMLLREERKLGKLTYEPSNLVFELLRVPPAKIRPL